MCAFMHVNLNFCVCVCPTKRWQEKTTDWERGTCKVIIRLSEIFDRGKSKGKGRRKKRNPKEKLVY